MNNHPQRLPILGKTLSLGLGILVGVACLGRASDSPPSTPGVPDVILTVLGPATNLSRPHTNSWKWTSSDPSVATVVEGWVFGKKIGTASIAAEGGGIDGLRFLVAVQPGVTLQPAPLQPVAVSTFITRRGNQLFDQEKPFRFISWNVPNLHVIEDASWRQQAALPKGAEPVYWHRICELEQEDAVKTVAQMGGQVIRCYTLAIPGGRRNGHGVSHYTGPGIPLNEELMEDYDRMIALCGQHGIHLIIPIIDEWDWFGGRREFAALSGGGDFYTDRKVVEDFKALIHQLVNRVNSVTGIAYKNDPTIMAWETGNELRQVPRAWTREIAAWLKDEAPHQLVSDGANGSLDSIDDPNVDMVTDHFYGGRDYIDRAMRDAARMGEKKPFFIGEFGCTDSDVELGTMDAALHSHITGALLWSLRFHSADGGFYWHDEGGKNSAYHWPGFSSNARSDEIHVLASMREKAWAIRGCLPPPIDKPDAPVLLPASTSTAIVWTGSTGADHYQLERSMDGVNWIDIAIDISDAAEPFHPFADGNQSIKFPVYYRIRAVNTTGESDWSSSLVVSN